MTDASSTSTTADAPKDKWDTVFAKPSRGSDSRSFGGDRGDSRGFGGDRGGDSRGFGGDRGDRDGDRRGYGGDRGGFSGDDDRFRGKFGQSSAPSVPVVSAPAATVAVSKEPSAADLKKKEEAEAKAAKAAARVEKERLEKEKKEAAARAREQELVEAKERQERSQHAAADTFASGKRGAELVSFIQELHPELVAAALLRVVFNKLEDPKSAKWATPSEFGAALAHLVKNNTRAQVELLYEVQAHCHAIKFPKIELKGKQHKLIDVLFRLLYSHEIIDSAGFSAWADDDNDANVPGKTDAIVHTTEFIAWLNEPELEEGEGDDDDEGFE